jgi:hypothetical protein
MVAGRPMEMLRRDPVDVGIAAPAQWDVPPRGLISTPLRMTHISVLFDMMYLAR